MDDMSRPIPSPEMLSKPFMLALAFMIPGVVLWIVLIGIALYIAGVVFMCIFLYRAWSLLPQSEARTSPGLAVGLCFVPLFNLYWMFVAFFGLAKDLNAYTRRHSISAPRASEGLTLAACILVLTSFVPLVGLFSGFVGAILLLVAMYGIKNTAVAIAASSAAPDHSAPV